MPSRYLARFNEDKNYIVLDLNAFDFFLFFPPHEILMNEMK